MGKSILIEKRISLMHRSEISLYYIAYELGKYSNSIIIEFIKCLLSYVQDDKREELKYLIKKELSKG
jgi:hypothetical protein